MRCGIRRYAKELGVEQIDVVDNASMAAEQLAGRRLCAVQCICIEASRRNLAHHIASEQQKFPELFRVFCAGKATAHANNRDWLAMSGRLLHRLLFQLKHRNRPFWRAKNGESTLLTSPGSRTPSVQS